MDGSSSGGGHSLGGGSSSSSSPSRRPLTQDELRQRRLASLESGGRSSTSSSATATTAKPAPAAAGGPKPPPPASVAAAAVPAAAPPPPPPPPPPPIPAPSALSTAFRATPSLKKKKVTLLEHDDGDADLQAALALSLQKDASVSGGAGISASVGVGVAAATNNAVEDDLKYSSGEDEHDVAKMHVDHSNNDHDDDGMVVVPCPDYTTEPCNIAAFHELMWDTNLTTENDKSRWVSQGIDVRRKSSSSSSSSSNDDDGEKKGASATAASTTMMSNTSTSSAGGNNYYYRTMLDQIASSHIPWGLQQHHGGPCGVMAAIQAEVLRILIWGRKQNKNGSVASSMIDYPPPTATAPESACYNSGATKITPELVRQALANSIALVLARATLTPSAKSQDDAADAAASEDTKPASATTTAAAAVAKVAECSMEEQPCVRIAMPIKPKTRMGLTWEDLEPWTANTTAPAATASTESSQALKIYSITAPSPAVVSDSQHGGPKRQKVGTIAQQHESLETRTVRLARSVARFLLQPFHHNKHQPQPSDPMSTDDDDNDDKSNNDKNNKDTDFLFLDAFCREGGVLLLVLSLVASRGKQVIQSEFDDSVGTKLTSQFGHCGQELINLLLTGQAVSNVFDNTMAVSGNLTCRGIQSRPAIGYLSQLEAMRYCEVGGYYKSPRFPVWVIGSTSHFTVLFGQAQALKESTSDLLLEKCRREFKAVEGGNENGFIATNQLGTVLKNLKVNVGSDDRVQTLAASLEVHGAGIILWDDFWKACSRLMSGVTLETLLQNSDDDMEEPPPLIYNVDMNPTEAPVTTVINSNNNCSDMMVQKPMARYPAAAAPASAGVVESDEEMARRLAEEWKQEGAASGIVALADAASSSSVATSPVAAAASASASVRVASPMQVEPTISADEALARKLQEEWNAEVSGITAVSAAAGVGDASSVAAVAAPTSPTNNNDTATLSGTPLPPLEPIGEIDIKPAAQSDGQQKLDFEKFGDSFALYHYNGLRGGVLTPFRITRLSAEEAVGASIALNRANGSNGSGQDLEDVVRTKWPSCMVDWKGTKPPYID